MKKTKEGKKKLEKKLLAYGVASGAALAMASPAGAAIHYFPQDEFVSNDTLDIDINNDGTPEFQIQHYATGTTYVVTVASASIQRYTTGNNADWKFDNNDPPGGGAERFNLGAAIGPTYGFPLFWGTKRDTLFSFDTSAGNYVGKFLGTGPNWGNPGYLGIRFDIPEESIHYGWIHIDSIESDLSGLHIDGWAYNDVADQPINAGAVPIPSSLALLASGAAGVTALRRRNRKKEQPE